MNRLKSFFTNLSNSIKDFLSYCKEGVWSDQRSIWYVGLIKTVNLSVRSYLDKTIQFRAGSLTYSTMLAAIPALALIFAIARGFGLQNVLSDQLFDSLPFDDASLTTILGFVFKYLDNAKGGVFVGIGIIFLIWSIVILLSRIESTFNHVWGIKKGRGPYRKMTDYTTIIIVIPILMICSAGISLFMSSFVQDLMAANDSFFSPILLTILDYAPFFLTCFVFAGMFSLIPNTKVKFKYALIPGFICGLIFRVLQYLFVGSQLYVMRYNAVYGGFAFLPLFMIWMYITWVIIISGAVVTYSAQNIFRFTYVNQLKNISQMYSNRLSIYIFLIILKRFDKGEKPLTKYEMMIEYNLPMQLLTKVLNKFDDAGMISAVTLDDGSIAYQPSRNFSDMPYLEFIELFGNIGESDFIDELKGDALLGKISELGKKPQTEVTDIKLKDIYSNQ